MEASEELCKHNRITRNCYLCYIHRNDDKRENTKTMLDTLHERISELKIRISKLEEYKRLQDDVNKKDQYFTMLVSKQLAEVDCAISNYAVRLCELEEHRKKQIDENRAVSKHFDEVDERLSNLESLPDFRKIQDVNNSIDTLHECGAEQAERIKDLEESYQGLSAELRELLDKRKPAINWDLVGFE